MSGFEIYLILQLDGFILALCLLAFFLVMAALIFFGISTENSVDKKTWVKRGIKSLWLALAFSIVATLIPNTKTAIAILTVPSILNDATAQKIPAKVLNVINKKLDSILKESNK